MKIFPKKTILLISVILIILISNVTQAAFTEPTTAPSSSDQDFPQNILGANNNNNDFDSTNVTANNDGSLIERLEYIITSLSSLWTKVGNLLYYNTGNVGIGTSTPSALLEVSGDGQSALKVTDVTNSITTGIWSGTTQGSIGTLTNTDLRFLTNGTSKMTIDTSGNVGVGTTGPLARLSVQGLGADILNLQDSTGAEKVTVLESGLVGIGTTAPATPLDVKGVGTNLTGTIYYNTFFRDGDQSEGLWLGYDTSANLGTIGSVGASSGLTFVTHNGSSWGERLRVQYDGNVGIGTTGPSYKFVVQTTGTSLGTGTSTALFWDGTSLGLHLGYDSSGAVIASAGADKPIEFWTYTSGAYGERMRITSTGNAGIGTTGPRAKQEISYADGTFTGATYVGQILSRTDAVSDAYGAATAYLAYQNKGAIVVGGGDGFKVFTYDGSTASERMRVSSGGNVGIGTTAPVYKLDVYGSARVTGTGAYLDYKNDSEAVDNRLWRIRTSGLEAGSFDIQSINDAGSLGNMAFHIGRSGYTVTKVVFPTGNVGIGTASPNAKLEIIANAGNVVYFRNTAGTGIYLTSGQNTWSTSSDLRLKDILGNIENANEKLAFLRPVYYKFKTEDDDIRRVGLIAQDVQTVFPEVVGTDQDGYLGIRYTELIPLTIKAIQEQQRQIDAIKLEKDTEIAELKARIEVLENK